MSATKGRMVAGMAVGLPVVLVFGALYAIVSIYADGVATAGAAYQARVDECLQRCEPHPVDEHTTKPDGSLGCICDETRTVR